MRQANIFSEVPSVDMARATFDRSHQMLTAFDAGYLIPFLVDDVLPGDTYNVNTDIFGRLATLLYPCMSQMYLETFYFFVPNRLVWDNWRKYCGEQHDPGDSIAYAIPYIESVVTGYTENSIFDYMGLPTKITGADKYQHSALPFRGLALIWNEWFRDQNLQNSLDIPTDDGPDLYNESYLTMHQRGKRHDYFTSCLPWLQKGTAVDLPLGTSAPLVGTLDVVTDGTAPTWKLNAAGSHNLQRLTGTDVDWTGSPATGTATWDDPHLEGDLTSHTADLSSATAATINEIREAFQIQRLLERDARAGTRYKEIIKSHFGVDFMDVTYRPEYLGGGSQRLDAIPIAQTARDASDDMGSLSAFATVGAQNHGFVKSFTEHGYVFGLMCLRGENVYQEGLQRHWSRSTRYDTYWPSLAHIGEQSVLNKEIYCQGVTANDDAVFGYQERFAEYRYKPSWVSGVMRSNATTSLDAWHLAYDFSSLPVLNSSFIPEQAPIDRIIATSSEPHLIVDARINMKCTRPMPLFAIPGMVDHF